MVRQEGSRERIVLRLPGHCHEKRDEITELQCAFCHRDGDVRSAWPESAFQEEDVMEWRLHKTPLKCAACKFEGDLSKKSTSMKACVSCAREVPLRGPPEVKHSQVASLTIEIVEKEMHAKTKLPFQCPVALPGGKKHAVESSRRRGGEGSLEGTAQI